MAVDVELLREMVREWERLIDHPVQAMAELNDKAEQMIKLAVALLAAGITLAGYVIQTLPDLVEPWFGVGILAGIVLNLSSIAQFLRAYAGAGPHGELHIGPHPAWMMDKTKESDWTLYRHLGSIVRSYGKYSDVNVGKMRDSAVRRTTGLAVMALAATAYAASMSFILGRVIIG